MKWKPTQTGKIPISHVRRAIWSQSFGLILILPAAIPGPYPTTAPPPDIGMADAYYVVDVGREVGIFTDKCVFLAPPSIALTSITSARSTRAATGVPGGHQLKMKTWYEAATHYNSLYEQDRIRRVPV